MDALIEKTIHFNCPLCHHAVEASAEASGKLISCPSCGEEFDSPRPAPKAQQWWLVVFCAALFSLALLVAIPLDGWIARRAAWAHSHETAMQVRLRLQSEADSRLSEKTTNAIVGLRTVVTRDTDFLNGDPNTWTAIVTADFINRLGGVERTSVPFKFWTYHSPVDGRDHVLCRVDDARAAGPQRTDAQLQVNLTTSK
jgi:hypothetical protein